MINLQFYSPEEEVFHPLLAEKEIRLFIKRDDQIHPFISGNKWRKLKYPLLQAEAEKKKHLVTFGGVWSNHLLATACAAAKFGFKSIGIVRGEDLQTDTLTLCRLFGMELIFVDREAYRDKQNLFETLLENHEQYYFIDEGGAGPVAAQGCSELVGELNQFYQHIFCASGTGTTAAGIINGITESSLDTSFHSVSVLKGDFLKEEIKSLLTQPVDFDLHTEYHFGGYAKTTPPLLSFIKDFATNTGILLDPVYTGKMMFAIFDLLKLDYFTAGTSVLAIHTGGLTGLLGMKDKFAKLQ